MVFAYDDYRSYLKSVLAKRLQKNRAYSQRAMALQLGLVSSQLSEVMGGKANFSLATAIRVSKALGLGGDQSDYFCWLVQLEAESKIDTKGAIVERLNRLRKAHRKRPVNDLTLDQFKQISEWYHSPILELADIPEFTTASIAVALGISPVEAEVAVERLGRLELLIRDEQRGWKRVPEDLRVTSPHQNAALRAFYKQMMAKAEEALEQQSPRERYSGYETVSVAEEALPEIRGIFDRAFDDVVAIAKKNPGRKRVYHLMLHFFDLTHRWKASAR